MKAITFGVEPHLDFQKALNDAGENGTVNVKAGIYHLQPSIIRNINTYLGKEYYGFVVPNNVTIKGEAGAKCILIVKSNQNFLAPLGSLKLENLTIKYEDGNTVTNFKTEGVLRSDFVTKGIELAIATDRLIYYKDKKVSIANESCQRKINVALSSFKSTLAGKKQDISGAKEAPKTIDGVLKALEQGKSLDSNKLKTVRGNLIRGLKTNSPSLNQIVVNYNLLLATYNPQSEYYNPFAANNAPKKGKRYINGKFEPLTYNTVNRICKQSVTSFDKSLNVTITNCEFENCSSIFWLDTGQADAPFLTQSALTNPRDILSNLPPVKLEKFTFQNNTINNCIDCVNINTAFGGLNAINNSFTNCFGYGFNLGKNVNARQNLWIGGNINKNQFTNLEYSYPYLSTKAILMYGTGFKANDNKINQVIGGNYNETWGLYTKATQTEILRNVTTNLTNIGKPYEAPEFSLTGYKGVNPFVNAYNFRIFPLDIKGAPMPNGLNIDGFGLNVSYNKVYQCGRGVGVRLYNTGIICHNNLVYGAKYGIATSGGIDYPKPKFTPEDTIKTAYSLDIRNNTIYALYKRGNGYTINKTDTSQCILPLYPHTYEKYSYGMLLPFDSCDKLIAEKNKIYNTSRAINLTFNFTPDDPRKQGYEIEKDEHKYEEVEELAFKENEIELDKKALEKLDGYNDLKNHATEKLCYDSSYIANISTAGEADDIDKLEISYNTFKGAYSSGIILGTSSKFKPYNPNTSQGVIITGNNFIPGDLGEPKFYVYKNAKLKAHIEDIPETKIKNIT